MPISIHKVLERLEKKGYQVQQTGDGYRSQCPAHEGDGMNLAFSLGKTDRVVFTCHSKHCSYEEIMKALDLWNENDKITVDRPALNMKPQSKYGKKVHPNVSRAVEAAAFGLDVRCKPDHLFAYPNEDGSENLFICRWDQKDGKAIRPVTKVEDGYIVGKATDRTYPIYRLPEIVKQIAAHKNTTARIVICEGEKAADAAAGVGYAATTSPFGSESAERADWNVLDRLAVRYNVKLELVVLPDNDEPGAKYAETLVGLFERFASRPLIKVVAMAEHGSLTGIENFPPKGDFADLCELLDGKEPGDIRKIVDAMIDMTESEAVMTEELEWEPFPVELLPDCMAKLCREAAKAKNIEPAYVATFAISAAASVLGSAYKIRLKKDWTEPAIIWTCLVTESGSGKSPGMDSAMQPLFELQDEADQKYRLQHDDYVEEAEHYQIRFDDWKKEHRKSPGIRPSNDLWILIGSRQTRMETFGGKVSMKASPDIETVRPPRGAMRASIAWCIDSAA